MKYIIFLIDGAADYPIRSLGGKTPLEVAKKPNIDSLAKKGRCGLFSTIPENFSTCSAVANLSVLGYDPLIHFHGRGVLEAASLGIKIQDNDIAFRLNTLCVKDGKLKNHSAGHISNEESHELIRFISDKLGKKDIKFYPGFSYRHVLVLKDKYSEHVTCIPPHDNPGKEISKIMPKASSEEGINTAELLCKLMLDSQEILENHPVNIKRAKAGKDKANMIWPWSPGRRPDMKTFQELYGLKGAVISAVDLIKGLGTYAGFDVIQVEGATGLHDTNYEGKADACIEALKNHDIVYVHVEATDEAGHEGDLYLKIKCIEYFDKRLLGRVLTKIGDDVSIGLLPDHPTPVEVRGHVSDPVPFLIYKPGQEPDNVQSFSEKECKKGGYGLLKKDGFIRALIQ